MKVFSLPFTHPDPDTVFWSVSLGKIAQAHRFDVEHLLNNRFQPIMHVIEAQVRTDTQNGHEKHEAY